MKILLVSPYDYSYPSGVNHHVLRLARQFSRMGHEVKTVFPSSRTKQTEGNIIFIGRPIPIPASGSVVRVPVSPRIFFSEEIARFLARENFNVVHLHEPFFPPLVAGFLWRSRTATIGTFHATRSRSWAYRCLHPLIQKGFERLEGRIAVSKAALDFVGRYFPGSYTIIPNGVDSAFFSPDIPPIEEFQDGKINILFVGRLEKRKGFGCLLEAYRHVKRENPKARLIAVGPGRFGHIKYSLLARSHGLKDVVFTGYVPFEQLLRYYRTADIVCSPATGNESFGMVLLEAMAAGKPVVASDIPGYNDLVEHGVQGLLVKPKDIGSLAGALRLLIKDEGLRRTLGKAGRQKAENYRWEYIAGRVMKLYEEALNNSLT